MSSQPQPRLGSLVERAYYAATIDAFIAASQAEVIGRLTEASEFAVDLSQRDAWQQEIALLQTVLLPNVGGGRLRPWQMTLTENDDDHDDNKDDAGNDLFRRLRSCVSTLL